MTQGDTDKSVASKASHLILVLLQAHPAMKAVVIREVAALVLKPPTPPPTAASKHVKFDKKEAGKKSSAEMHKAAAEHARYYGIITLNQMMLSTKERDVAARLVEVYFEVFRELLGMNSTLDTETKDEDGQEKITGKVHNWQGRKKGTRNGKKRDEKKKEGEVESGDAKLIAAVLTGVTRALPYARLEDEV
jgi:ribosome biogenesis protein MAK21